MRHRPGPAPRARPGPGGRPRPRPAPASLLIGLSDCPARLPGLARAWVESPRVHGRKLRQRSRWSEGSWSLVSILEHPGYASPADGGPALPDHRRRLHRGRRGRAAGRRLPRVLRPLPHRARQDHRHRRQRGAGGAGRGGRVHRRRPGRPAAPPRADDQPGDGPDRCWPPARSGSSASRWRPCVTESPTRARTRSSWSTWTTTRCPRWSDFDDALAGDTVCCSRRRHQRGRHLRRRATSCKPTCSTAARRWSARRSSTSGSPRRRWRAGPRPRSGARTGG